MINFMRIIFLFIALNISSFCYGQQDGKISTIDFVQVLNDNKAEVVFYYQNNWKQLREMALKKGFIDSYQFLETQASEAEPFHFMLITTYQNKEQYDLSEPHFEELIEQRGSLKLMNDKKPNEFRKILFSKDLVKHLN